MVTTKKGTSASNTINGTSGSDRIYGYDGNDTLSGRAGNDTLNGGNGNDRLDGGNGDDRLLGGSGSDRYIRSAGNDLISDTGGSGDRLVIGLSSEEASGILFQAIDRDSDESFDSLEVTIDEETITIVNYFSDNSNDLGDLSRGAGCVETIALTDSSFSFSDIAAAVNSI